MQSNWTLARSLCHVLASAPLFYSGFLVWRALGGDIAALGADPAESLMSYLGEWAIILLIVTLTVSPLNQYVPAWRLIRYRRAWGLWTFVYVCVHLLLYVGVIIEFDLATLVEDLLERPFIILGMLGFCLLIPLAVTSTRGWQRRLGQGWRKLHRLIYLVAIAGTIHFFLQVRSDYTDFALIAVPMSALLLFRLYRVWRNRRAPA